MKTALKWTPLQKAVSTIALLTIATKALSLLRDSLIATHLGTSASADLFFFIIDWSNLLTTLIATAAANLFIPRLQKMLKQAWLGKAVQFYLSKFYTLLTIVFIFALLVFLTLSPISTVVTLLACFIFLVQTTSYFLTTLLNLKGRFVFPTLLTALPILAIILYFYTPWKTTETMLLFYFAGGLIQLIVLLVVARSHSIPVGLPALQNSKRFSLGLKSMGWIVLTTLYFPLANFLNIQLAAFLPVGAISTISYASRVSFAVSNILIYSFWTVALPTTLVSKGQAFLNKQVYSRLLKIGLVTLAMSLILYPLSPLIVELLYGQGNLANGDEILLITKYQKWYFLGLTFQVVVSLLIRYLQIMDEAPATFIAGGIGLTLQVICFFASGLQVAWIPLGFVINFFCVGVSLGLFTFFRFRQQSRVIGPKIQSDTA